MNKTMEMYSPSHKKRVMAEVVEGYAQNSKGGTPRLALKGLFEGKKTLPKKVDVETFEKYGFNAEQTIAAFHAESVGEPLPESPLEDAPSDTPFPQEPSNENFSADDGCEKYRLALRKMQLALLSPDEHLWWESAINDYVTPAFNDMGWNTTSLPHTGEGYDDLDELYNEIESIDTTKGCGEYIKALKTIQAELISPSEEITWDDVGETVKREILGLGWRIDSLEDWDEWENNWLGKYGAEDSPSPSGPSEEPEPAEATGSEPSNESFSAESLVEEPAWIPAGDGNIVGQQNFGINMSPLHAESFNAENCVSCETPDWFWVGGLCSDSGELKCIACCYCDNCHNRYSQLESGEIEGAKTTFSPDQKFHDAESQKSMILEACGICDKQFNAETLNADGYCGSCCDTRLAEFDNRIDFSAETDDEPYYCMDCDDRQKLPVEEMCPKCLTEGQFYCWECCSRNEGDAHFSAESKGISKNAQIALGLTALGVGIAVWKSDSIMNIIDKIKKLGE